MLLRFLHAMEYWLEKANLASFSGSFFKSLSFSRKSLFIVTNCGESSSHNAPSEFCGHWLVATATKSPSKTMHNMFGVPTPRLFKSTTEKYTPISHMTGSQIHFNEEISTTDIWPLPPSLLGIQSKKKHYFGVKLSAAVQCKHSITVYIVRQLSTPVKKQLSLFNFRL